MYDKVHMFSLQANVVSLEFLLLCLLSKTEDSGVFGINENGFKLAYQEVPIPNYYS